MDLSSVLATLDCGQAITLLLSTVMIEISLEFCNTEVFAVRGIFFILRLRGFEMWGSIKIKFTETVMPVCFKRGHSGV